MSAKFDEFPSLPFQDIKEKPKCHGGTDARTERRMDNVKIVYPPQTMFAGSITKWHVRPVKTQISLGICPVRSESLLSAWRKLGSLATHWVHSKDSDHWMAALCVWKTSLWRTKCTISSWDAHLVYKPIFNAWHPIKEALANIVDSDQGHMSLIMRKPVFGGFWPGKTRTGLLHDQS